MKKWMKISGILPWWLELWERWMKNNSEMFFDKGYFESGEEELGVYQSYQLEDYYPRFLALATSIKSLFNPKRLPDVGCAKGFLVKAFEDIGVPAWGVDVSEYAISNAPAGIRSRLHRMDLNKDALPFEDEFFDFVTVLGTIEYLENHQNAINEIKRVLRKGGGLYLRTIYGENLGGLLINVHDEEYWIKELESSGFRCESGKRDEIIQETLKNRFLLPVSEDTMRFKIEKILYQKGGYIGKRIVYSVNKLLLNNNPRRLIHVDLYFARGD